MDDASGDADTDTDHFTCAGGENDSDNKYGCARHNLWCEDTTGCVFLCVWETEKQYWGR